MGKEVARRVIQEVGKGRNPKKTEIAEEVGYSKESARSGKATQTKGYQEVMGSFISKMEKERDRIIEAMSERKLTMVEYRDLTNALDKFTKNIELLSGRDTSRVGGLVDEIFDKL